MLRAPKVFRPTRRAHQAALAVEYASPDEADLFHDRLYAAVWIHEQDIEDPALLESLAEDLDVPPGLIERIVSHDELLPALASSMERAHAWGATGTPSWVIDNKLMVPGLQDDHFFDRVLTRLSEVRLTEPQGE